MIRRPPALPHRLQCSTIGRLRLNRRVRDGNGCFPQAHRHRKYQLSLDNSTVKHISIFYFFPRKEVIQPHLPVRLPCYDFTPLTLHTFDASAPFRGSAGGFGCRRLGWCDGRCVQGPGTYSPRRADPRLLATPASRRRVAAPNPNWGRLSGIRSPSRGGIPLYRPL